jgi:hypothetical protein
LGKVTIGFGESHNVHPAPLPCPLSSQVWPESCHPIHLFPVPTSFGLPRVEHATVVILIQHSLDKCPVFHHLEAKSGQQLPTLEPFPLSVFLLVWQIPSNNNHFLGSCYQPISSRTVILQLWDILPHDILIPEALCCVSSCICLVALISTASRAHPGHAKFLNTFWSAVAQFVFLPPLRGQAKCIDVCL